MRNLLQEDTVYTTAEMLDRIMAEDDAHDPNLAELQQEYDSGNSVNLNQLLAHSQGK